MTRFKSINPYHSFLFKKVLLNLQATITPFVWITFFKNLKFQSIRNNTIEILTPSIFTKKWIQKYGLINLYDSIFLIFNQKLEIKIIEKQQLHYKQPKTNIFPYSQNFSQKHHAPQQYPAHHYQIFPFNKLNPSYTLNNFLTDSETKMLTHISLLIASYPGSVHNPLFICGPSGTGKTHLAQAIGNQILEKNSRANILYTSAEEWSNLFIHAVINNKVQYFRQAIRETCDVLILDDLHFFSGKEACQNEFLYTYNNFFQNKKQIIATSLSFPYHIKGLNFNLQSRFSGGLILDTKPPSKEINHIFITKKFNSAGLDITSDVIEFLANHPYKSMRELEGVTIRLIAFSYNGSFKLSMKEAKTCLRQVAYIKPSNRQELEIICSHVASHFGVSPSSLKSHQRNRYLVFARQLAMALCKKIVPCTLVEIGKTFGGRDHSTVISSLKKIKALEESNIQIQILISKLQNTLSD